MLECCDAHSSQFAPHFAPHFTRHAWFGDGRRHPLLLGQVLRDIVGVAWKRNPGRPESSTDLNPLEEYFYNNPSRAACKWGHYFEIYHRHLQRYRGKSPVVVEIGVAAGGSLPMWHHYFGRGARVVGIDVDPACRQFADDKT